MKRYRMAHAARALAGTMVTAAAAAAMPQAASAHAVAAHEGPPTLATAWSLSPLVVLPLLLLAVAYAVGAKHLWRRAGARGGRAVRESAAFAAGVATLFLATIWPLDAFGEWSLGAHMAQHMALLALAPPLLIAGQPLATIAHALPPALSKRLHRAGRGVAGVSVAALTLATLVHCGVMWAWHLPAATTAALESDPLHWAMHASFLVAGIWFWRALWHRLREPELGVGPALVAVVAVMMQMGLLGALLTFAGRPLYPVYVERAPALGLDVLADQQLAGLLMWVPACLPYVVGGLWLAARALREPRAAKTSR